MASRIVKAGPNLFLYTVALIFLLVPNGFVSAVFSDTGLINIPTAYIMNNGIFDARANTTILHEKRQELVTRMDFGLLNFAEFGVTGIKDDDKDYLMCNAKVLMARESGILPGFAVGVDNLGEKIESQDYNLSFYAVLSKQFNLPFIHIIKGHLGIGNKRYIYDESIGKYLHGAFFGLSKELVLTSRNIRLLLMSEVKGKNVNAGLKYMMNSGLTVNLAVEGLNSDANDIIYHIGVGFTNAPMMKDIAQSIELAKQAVKIANEARKD
jgi:hypothetical protein